jgi:DNA-binding MarR family transcriptional regulator
MNKTAQLVLNYAEFEEKYPNSSLEDFARYLLSNSKSSKDAPDSVKPHVRLAKVIGRIMRLNSFYANAALKSIDLSGLDEYTYLNSVQLLGEPMKTELINQNFHELSSGLLIINRLQKKGLIREKPDPQDKRSKHVILTSKGASKLGEAQNILVQVCRMFFERMDVNDIMLSVSMLAPVEQEFSTLWPIHKGKTFQEIMESMDERSQ